MQQPQPPAPHGAAILVVDDEEDIAETAREVIEHFLPGSHVVTAESSAAGLAALRRAPFDAVLVDYRMPDGNGLDFIRAAHGVAPDVPAILMTAYGSIEVATEAVNACHVDGFLSKPVGARQLADAIQGAIARSHGIPQDDGVPMAW
jgi:DNA-binding NtrC family response regulator